MLAANYYLIFQENQVVSLTSYPEAALAWLKTENEGVSTNDTVWIWDRPYPLWLAELIRDLLRTEQSKNIRPNRQKLGRAIRNTAKSWGWTANGRWVAAEETRVDRYLPEAAACHAEQAAPAADSGPAVGEGAFTSCFAATSTDAEIIAQTLSGRLLTLKELHLILGKKGRSISLPDLERALQKHILDGSVLLRAGVGPDRLGRFTCRRCGSTDRVIQTYAGYTPELHWRCEACQSMGTMTSATPLYQWIGPRPAFRPTRNIRLLLPKLTWWQEKAAQEAIDFWQETAGRRWHRKALLIWAVCGAGKTEIIFPLLQQALSSGKRALLTVPRREVAADLGRRVEKAFPGLKFALLYGGKKREPSAPLLTICTTHQLLRFTDCFDLAILDEADAFPFSYEPMLARALHGALRPAGRLVYMTATPDARWRKLVRQGKVGLIRIPLRHHGYPLPVPVIMKLPLPVLSGLSLNTDRSLSFPKQITDFLTAVITRARRALVFTPTVKAAETVGRYLQASSLLSYGGCLDYVHSKDPKREEKLTAFAAGKLKILVTTTLLERGLTFPDLDVLVLYADQKTIFSTETLVQIAGRVGRSASSPSGEVVMIAGSVSRQMQKARKWIVRMNKEAGRLMAVKR